MGLDPEQVLFLVDGQEYRWNDVKLAAQLWGDWRQLEDDVRWGLACCQQLEEEGEEINEDSAAEAANNFRYERDLTSAADMEAWLQQWNLDVDDWTGAIERALLRDASTSAEDLTALYPITDEEVERSIDSDAVCSGYLRRFCRKLAARAAIASSLREGHAGDDAVTVEERLASFERVFQGFVASLHTPKAIHDQIISHQLDWTRIEAAYLTFSTEDAAREAALCIRQDGLTLTELAEEVRTPVQVHSCLLTEIDKDIAHLFLSARAGELLGPMMWEGAHGVVLLTSKTVPTEHDPDARELAKRTLVNAAVEHAINKHVRWLCRF